MSVQVRLFSVETRLDRLREDAEELWSQANEFLATLPANRTLEARTETLLNPRESPGLNGMMVMLITVFYLE